MEARESTLSSHSGAAWPAPGPCCRGWGKGPQGLWFQGTCKPRLEHSSKGVPGECHQHAVTTDVSVLTGGQADLSCDLSTTGT